MTAKQDQSILRFYSLGWSVGMIADRFKVSREYVASVLESERRRAALRYQSQDMTRQLKGGK